MLYNHNLYRALDYLIIALFIAILQHHYILRPGEDNERQDGDGEGAAEEEEEEGGEGEESRAGTIRSRDVEDGEEDEGGGVEL